MQARAPRTDDKPLWDVQFGAFAYPVVFAAHRLKLFELLADGPLTPEEIGAALELEPRPVLVLLSVTASLGFVERRDDGRFANTILTEDYLLPDSPTYFGSSWDGLIDTYEVYSYSGIEKALRTNSRQLMGDDELFRSEGVEGAIEQAAVAQWYTRTMHSISVGPATGWPDALDLSGSETLLDIGGGSGAHAIGAAARWPHLRATVFDLGPVCEVAQEFIAAAGLDGRVTTHPGDMWEDAFPDADVHFYSNIFHDWPPDKCQVLAAKSFAALPPGGRIVLHEVLFDDDRAGPLPAAAYSMMMLIGADGQQFSGAELASMLGEAGFRDVEITPTFGYYNTVCAIKPID